MKFYVVFTLGFLLSSVMCTTEEMKQLVAALHNTCIGETGIDEAVLAKVNSEKVLPDDDKLKCYLKCLLTQMGVMDDNGMIDSETYLGIMSEEDQKTFGSVLKKCGTKVGVNHCDNAWLTHRCYLENAPETYYVI